MLFPRFFLALSLVLILSFFLTRGGIYIYINNQLSKRQRQKKGKKQTFVEWFFYKRYLDVLPKWKLVLYYSNFILYLLFIAAYFALRATGADLFSAFIWTYLSVMAVFTVALKQ